MSRSGSGNHSDKAARILMRPHRRIERRIPRVIFIVRVTAKIASAIAGQKTQEESEEEPNLKKTGGRIKIDARKPNLKHRAEYTKLRKSVR